MWFVQRKEILTKHNLFKRNWPSSTKCCFCEQNESIEHFFINCPFAKIIWQIVYMAFNITPPVSIVHMFGTWLNRIVKSEKRNIRVGVCAILTTIWHMRNNFNFNKSCFPTFLQVIPLTVHWIHMCGLISSRWSSARTWILGATIWRRSHRISTADSGGILMAASLIDAFG
jgi:hypothetical protein